MNMDDTYLDEELNRDSLLNELEALENGVQALADTIRQTLYALAIEDSPDSQDA